MRSVTVLAPAKLNISLDILGTNEKGYHELDMIMQAVNLYETITVRTSSKLVVRLPGSTIPVNQYNTAIKAALAFFGETGLLAGADIVIHKAIPVRAGMAGGSADAAGVLVALNKLYNAGLTREQLCDIGLKVGADVPFCIMGGTARVRGIGDKIHRLPDIPRCHMCVCMPSTGVSTRDAFARYDKLGAKKHPDCTKIENAIVNGSLADMLPHMYNVLEETHVGEDNKRIRAILDASGAMASMMTGSGAAVFGIFKNKSRALRAQAALAKEYESIWVVHPADKGVKILGK